MELSSAFNFLKRLKPGDLIVLSDFKNDEQHIVGITSLYYSHPILGEPTGITISGLHATGACQMHVYGDNTKSIYLDEFGNDDTEPGTAENYIFRADRWERIFRAT